MTKGFEQLHKISDASKSAVINEKLLRLQVNIAVSTRNAFS